MKVTLNWLKQYVDFNWTPEELTERLTMLGLEVEGVQKLSGEFEGVVVAEVITRDKHPNADKLSLCRVADGKGERQIVCGATNFKAGDKVPLILPGASLPMKPGEKEPFTIKVGKIRGVESQGMMCSPKELGLAEDADGLLLLRGDAKVGQPFSEYLGRASGDVVYDLETTPNRPDWNSVIGIAREISALTGNPLKLPEIKLPSLASEQRSVSDLVGVRLDAPDLCPRYTARLVRGVKIGPSPDWLRQALEKVGIRSINNVVDVTNFVLMETGQPLHAFDYNLLAVGEDARFPTVVVRRAAEGEKFKTLDGQVRNLTPDMLLIADETRGIALAGVMGGQNSEINEATEDVLIESAWFHPGNIRATSKRLELRTDASYRFERGADIGICDWASQRAAQLILETAGGELASGVVDAYPAPAEAKQITLRPSRTDQLLGISIPREEQIRSLVRLGLIETANPAGQPESSATFAIPSFRHDLKREADLIEEITRLHGVDKIPSTPPRGAIGSNAFDSIHDQLGEARQLLVSLGLSEAQGQTLIGDAQANRFAPDLVLLSNPLSSDMNALRPSLLPGLLDSLHHNLSRKNPSVALFEIGRTFHSVSGQIKEGRKLAIALTGPSQAAFWSGEQAKFDIYDLKGAVEEFLQRFGITAAAFVRQSGASLCFLEHAAIQLGRQTLGQMGQLLPALAKQYDLRDPVLLAEFDLDLLLARRNTKKSFKPLPSFPAIRRDIAMVLNESVTHDAVLDSVRQAKTANLESVELFDVFRGKNVPSGQKSVAYAFTYRSAERTLTDSEVNAAHEKLTAALEAGLKASIRKE